MQTGCESIIILNFIESSNKLSGNECEIQRVLFLEQKKEPTFRRKIFHVRVDANSGLKFIICSYQRTNFRH